MKRLWPICSLTSKRKSKPAAGRSSKDACHGDRERRRPRIGKNIVGVVLWVCNNYDVMTLE